MRFLADECCDFAVVRSLRARGYDVLAVSEFQQRSVDKDLVELALAEKRILLTEDKVEPSTEPWRARTWSVWKSWNSFRTKPVHGQMWAGSSSGALAGLIQKLRPLDRQVIVCYLEDMDAVSIGEITGLSPASVAMRIDIDNEDGRDSTEDAGVAQSGASCGSGGDFRHRRFPGAGLCRAGGVRVGNSLGSGRAIFSAARNVVRDYASRRGAEHRS